METTCGKAPMDRSTKIWIATIFFPALITASAILIATFVSSEAMEEALVLLVGTLENTLVQAFPMMLVALGMTLVISSGGIDISVGAIMAISGAVSARLYASGFGLAPSIGCGIAAAALCGLCNGVLIAKFKIQPIIVTLAVMIAGRALAQIILGNLFTSLLFTSFGDLGQFELAGKIPVQIVIMAAAIAVMLFVARKTVFAKHVEAIGDNCRAARLLGVNTVAVTIGVYVLCAILCGIAGNMAAARSTIVNVGTLGVLVELDANAAVAIGGTSFSGGRARILGTVFGAIVVQLVTVVVNMTDIPFNYSLIFKAMIVIIAIWAQRKK